MKAVAAVAVFFGVAGAVTSAAAEVVAVDAAGFQIRNTVEVAAPPAKVWRALLEPGDWWHPEHSWSGDARNLSLEARAGGCFCERWSGGEAMHMLVTFVRPDQELRLWGALGPLSLEGAVGGMAVKLEPTTPGATRVTLTYTVGGRLSGGAARWAPLVDGVLRAQLERLGRYAETGAS
ncbi:MAG TPA: SRPBCC domain-containing protein [Caulobacteraceae bacterium]